ncbi:winged helix DNA-binding protein [Actinoallomurus purpureus]|uniref:MarR family winged helix-turn-helix transcriptional regulator n=1 Tax=Actinoallomurus purpureus TaxID=478114 RepID=UPI002093DEF9|nr:MarR family transcriptional regulator [Actinoallomurus purpureus]MCO6003929.1 winged helix DNA-binding protein [Actinoallomurus purpureus]
MSATADDRPGFELPLLLLAGFRALIDELHAELARQGHPHARPVHGFAMQAIGPGGASASEVGRRLGVSKQAAGKTIDRLEEIGYAERVDDPADGRRKLVRLTPRGVDALTRSAAIFDRLRSHWAAALGADRLADLEDALRAMTGPTGLAVDTVSWLAT